MRFATAAAAVLTLATPALPQSAISTEIGQTGIAATLARLEAQAEKAPAEIFATGGLHFLVALESALQWQWRSGPSVVGAVLELSLLDPDASYSPDPTFSGASLTQLATDIDAGLQRTLAALDSLPKDADFDLEVSLGDLWFDINMNNSRDPGEDAGELIGGQILGWRWSERDQNAPPPVIRFDGADVAWLMALSHRFSAMTNSFLAYDATAAIDDVIATRASLGIPMFVGLEGYGESFGRFLDAFVVVEQTLRQTPDAQRMASAKSHLLQMIVEYRRFWTMVAAEPDNDREWIPNQAQTSAFGLTLPPKTADTWQSALTDAEALLNGQLLMPFWRGADGQGFTVAKFFDTPQPIDLTGWVQGAAVVPHLQKGNVVSDRSLYSIGQILLGNFDQPMDLGE